MHYIDQLLPTEFIVEPATGDIQTRDNAIENVQGIAVSQVRERGPRETDVDGGDLLLGPLDLRTPIIVLPFQGGEQQPPRFREFVVRKAGMENKVRIDLEELVKILTQACGIDEKAVVARLRGHRGTSGVKNCRNLLGAVT